MAEQTPDSIITTQKNGQTIVAELFFNHSGTETFRDKLLKVILAEQLAGRSRAGKIGNFAITAAPTIHSPSGRFLSSKTPFSPSQEPEKTPEKCPLLRNRGAERESLCEQGFPSKKRPQTSGLMRKTRWIHIRTHNTDLKKRLAAYASSTPMCAARPTQTRKRAAWSLTLRKAASLSV